jgi:hypothetical protein
MLPNAPAAHPPWLGVRPDAVGVSTLLLQKESILCAAARVDTADAPGLPGPGSPKTGLQPQAQRKRRRAAQVGSDAEARARLQHRGR